MDPPRQVSRRGPGTGPVFRTFKKSSVPSFASGPNSSIRTISALPGLRVTPNFFAPLPVLQCPVEKAPVPLAEIVVSPLLVVSPPIKRDRINADQRNIINMRDTTLSDLKRSSSHLSDVDIVLNPRLRGNRGIRTSGIHKADDSDVIAAVAASLNKNSIVEGIKSGKSMKTVAPKRIKKIIVKPRRVSASTEKVRRST